ncbi:MAG TPA: spermidine/putrescine ABC transporter substrate-binding protein [Leptolyngbyaceae cyanobacterium]
MRFKKFGPVNQHSRLFNSSRRRFLQFSAAAVSTVALANCQRQQSAPSSGTSSQAAPKATGSDEPLHIYTWADYSNEEVYQRFTEKTGIKVVADVYDANETMLAKLQAGGGKQYSILYPSDYIVQEMVDGNLITEIDHSKLKGLDNLRDRWQSPPYDPENKHSIPVSWGTTGLIYNTDLIKSAPEDWNYLWDNQKALSGKITLLEDVREMMGVGLKSLGYSYNSTDPKEIEAAYNKLRELKPAVVAFKSFGWEDQLIARDLALSVTYSVVGNALPQEHPNLQYVIPKSGSSIWTDTMVIPQGAPNPEAAYAWINFMLEPENAAFAVEKLTFATPNQSAFDLLPNELKESKTLFPPDDMLEKCEGIEPLDDATLDLYDKYWTQLTSL